MGEAGAQGIEGARLRDAVALTALVGRLRAVQQRIEAYDRPVAYDLARGLELVEDAIDLLPFDDAGNRLAPPLRVVE